MSESEKAYWTAEVAQILSTSTSTINRWTRSLEDLGYYIIAGTDGRAYTEKDINIFRQMQSLARTSGKTKTSELARLALGLGPSERYVDHDRTRSRQSHVQSIEHDRDEPQSITHSQSIEQSIDHSIEQSSSIDWVNDPQFIKFVQTTSSVIATLENKIQNLEHKLEENNSKQRLDNVDVWMLRQKVRLDLKFEAEKAWSNLPKEQREHKVRRFLLSSTVENVEKKRWFILEYVNERIDLEIAKRMEEKLSLQLPPQDEPK